MRLNLGLIVDTLSGRRGKNEDFPICVDRLKGKHGVTKSVMENMKHINAMRNLVVHEYIFLDDWQWHVLLEAYAEIEDWAREEPMLKKAKLAWRPVPLSALDSITLVKEPASR